MERIGKKRLDAVVVVALWSGPLLYGNLHRKASVGAGTPLEPQKLVDTMKGGAKAGGSVKMELYFGKCIQGPPGWLEPEPMHFDLDVAAMVIRRLG